MARRRPGVGGIRKDNRVKVRDKYLTVFFDLSVLCLQEKFAAKGTELADLQLSYVSTHIIFIVFQDLCVIRYRLEHHTYLCTD